jgi:hypothetical protein
MKKNYRVHLTRKSTNRKTGPIPVSTTERSTCPSDCPLKKDPSNPLSGGCYAEQPPLLFHWNAVSRGDRGMDWEDFCKEISKLPSGQLWRHNQAGDLPGDGVNIDKKALDELVEANKHRRGFTYTHYNIINNLHNRIHVESAISQGFVINASANDMDEADRLYDIFQPVPNSVLPSNSSPPIPITVTLPSTLSGNFALYTRKGRRVVVCPASYRDDISCAKCQLCAVPHTVSKKGEKEPRVIIGFPAHGKGTKRINTRLEKHGEKLLQDNTRVM